MKHERNNINDYEEHIYSQNGEDGIIKYLLSEIGSSLNRFIEIGFHPSESNCLRLMELGYSGLFIDKEFININTFKNLYHNYEIGWLTYPRVKVINEFITKENINNIINKHNNGHRVIDVLSIDIDGNDYHIWEAIDESILSAKIVVIEYNAILSAIDNELSITIPYDPKFDYSKYHSSELYFGASLPALEKLGREKGYSLVGCDNSGVNAFFVKNYCLTPNIKVLSCREAYKYSQYVPKVDIIFDSISNNNILNYQLVKDFKWEKV